MSADHPQQERSLCEVLLETEEYTRRLFDLPDYRTFKDTVESALWDEITAVSDPGSRIPYDDLTDAGQSVIGYHTTDDGETQLPWWLTEFEWTLSYGEEEIELTNVENIDAIESFDRRRTEAHRPELRSKKYDPMAIDIHEILLGLRESLQEIHDVSPPGEALSLPTSLFEISSGVIMHTDAFDEWLNEYIRLLPGQGLHATALLNAQTNTGRESAEAVLSDELYDAAASAGLFPEDTLYNESICGPLERVLSADGFLSVSFPVPDDYDALAGLAYAYYEAYAASGPYDEQTTEYIDRVTQPNPGRIEAGMLPEFTRAAFGAPFRRKRDSPALSTISIYADGTSYYSSQSETLGAIRRLFEDSEIV